MNKIKDQILTMLLEHSRLIYTAISDMGVFYSGWAENYEKNKSNLEKKKNKMVLTEEDGDEIKIKLIKEFSEASTQGLQSYLTLILRMDNVINYPLEFVDMLPKIKLDGFISGHDYNNQKRFGVKKAVNKFFPNNHELGENMTWFVTRP